MLNYALTVKQSPLFTYLSFIGCQKKYFKETLHLDYELPEALYQDGDIFWNYKDDVDFNREFLKEKTLNQAVEDFILALEKASNNLEKITHRYPSFNQYIESYLLNMPFLFHFWNVEYLLTSQLKKDFKRLFKEKGETLLQKVLVPSKDTYFTKERKSLQNMKKYLGSPRLKTMLKKHIDTFGFTSVVFGTGKPPDEKTLLERIMNLSIVREDKSKLQGILRKLRPHKDIYKRVKLAQQIMFWKNQRLDIMFKCDFLMMPKFSDMEIKKWFKNKSIPAKSIFKKRMQGYVLHLKNGKISLSFSTKKPKNKSISDTKILKGKVAYKGKITGKVKLVFEIEDIKKIEKGDILVAKMTRPEMIVGLEKAAGFVTDQGGMLSHAAIVAREMRKPCIVGTKIATQVLQDGDLIEVNANIGVVKKLN